MTARRQMTAAHVQCPECDEVIEIDIPVLTDIQAREDAIKDEEPDELPEHYCVSLGEMPDEQRAEDFGTAFLRRRRDR